MKILELLWGLNFWGLHIFLRFEMTAVESCSRNVQSVRHEALQQIRTDLPGDCWVQITLQLLDVCVRRVFHLKSFLIEKKILLCRMNRQGEQLSSSVVLVALIPIYDKSVQQFYHIQYNTIIHHCLTVWKQGGMEEQRATSQIQRTESMRLKVFTPYIWHLYWFIC